MAATKSVQGRGEGASRGRGVKAAVKAGEPQARWTFLSNHSHVLICLHREPELTMREVAERVGITERSVQRILRELEEGGFVRREKQGLRNRYKFKMSARLRHPIESHRTIGDLISMVES